MKISLPVLNIPSSMEDGKTIIMNLKKVGEGPLLEG